MADTTEEDQSRERSRSLASLSASKWRDKLKEKANKFSKGVGKLPTEHDNNNVSDFLGTTSTASTESKPSSLGLTIPPADRLDPSTYAPARTVTFRKRPKPKGLHVTFATQKPEVIGEGGDESEVPAKDVVGSWKGLRRSPRSSSEIQSNHHIGLPTSLASPTNLPPPKPRSPPASTRECREANSGQSFLQRAPTRRPVGGWEQRRQSMNMEEGLVQAQSKEDVEGHQLGGIDVPVLDPTPPVAQPTAPPEHARVLYPTSPGGALAPRQPYSKPSQASDASGSFVAYNPSMPKTAPPVPRSPHNLAVPSQGIGRADTQRTLVSDEKRLPTDASTRPPRTEPSPQRSRSATTATAAMHLNGVAQDLLVRDYDENATGQAESEDFYSRMQHLRGVFRLAAEKSIDIENKALEHWIRVSAWWFLRGKTTLEKQTKASRQDKSDPNPSEAEQQGQQCYIDLAKAWWAMEDVLPELVDPHSAASIRNTLDSFDGLDYSNLLAIYNTIQSNMRSFALFMKRSNIFPPPALHIQGADPCIWVEYPTLPPGILALTAGLDPRTLTKRTKRPFFPILFADSERFFSYGRVFGEAEIVSEDGEAEDQQLPCIISIIREKTRSQADLTIVSQDGQINLHVQSDPKIGPTWKDVEWKVKAHSIRIRLSRDFQVALRLWDDDFRILWGINNYIKRVEADWQPQENEELLFDNVINMFHFSCPVQSSGNFPSVPVRNCPVRLFERRSLRIEGQAQRKLFDGLRLVVVTPPNTKTLSSISRIFGKGAPTLYSNLRGEADAPALMFAIRESNEKTSLILTFKDTTQRAELHTLMAAVTASRDETVSLDISLERMWVEELFSSPSKPPDPYAIATSAVWKSVKVIDRGPLDSTAQKTFSDHLRICSTCNLGTVVDLANLGTSQS